MQAVDMSAVEPRQKIARPHFSEAIKQTACECLNSELQNFYGSDYRQKVTDILAGKWQFRTGGGRTGPIDAAYIRFQNAYFCSRSDGTAASKMEKGQFYKLVRRWSPQWLSGINKNCEEHRVRRSEMKMKDAKKLARLLKQPGRDQLGVHYWRSLEDALESHPKREEIARLVALAAMSHAALEEHLLDVDPDLHHGPIDQREEMAHQTLVGRRECAKILRRDLPWLVRTGEELALLYVRVQNVPEGWQPIFWEADYIIMMYFLFQLDAFTLEETDVRRITRPQGFRSKSVVYQPEVTPKIRSGTSARHVMAYIAINGVLGLACPLWATYFGSTPTRKPRAIRNDRDPFPARHEEWFPHWCAPGSLTSCWSLCVCKTSHNCLVRYAVSMT